MDPIINGTRIIKFDHSNEIIIHFGINPISGGKPPSDRRRVGRIIILLKENDDLSINWCEYIISNWFRYIKIGVIRNEYISKYAIAAIEIYDVLALNIHPIWVIDENAIIDFILVCIIPVVPPTSTFNRDTSIIIFIIIDDIKENMRIDIGASFCIVLRIRQDHHEIDVITDGNHMWHGAIPSFITIDAIISIDDSVGKLGVIIMIVASRSNLDPIAWIRKYLIIASNSWNFDEFTITGMKDNMFSSSPIHMVSQLLDDKIIIIDVGIII